MSTPDEVDDIVDDVNALLRMRVGDPYRLEHIKQAYIENKTIWESDNRYLQKMKEKYLTKLNTEEKIQVEEIPEESEDNSEKIHCWKCGKKCPLKANFCMSCGAALFEVGNENPPPTKPNVGKVEIKRSFNFKIPLMIGIPVLVLAVFAGAYSQGYFDNTFERNTVEPEPIVTTPPPTTGETNSKCGKGTVYDPETNACVLANSKCGTGTIYDTETNSCILA